MINKLKWRTLQCRRNIDKLIMFYNMLTGHVSLDSQNYLHPNTSSTRGHNLRYRQIGKCLPEIAPHLPSTIRLWLMLYTHNP